MGIGFQMGQNSVRYGMYAINIPIDQLPKSVGATLLQLVFLYVPKFTFSSCYYKKKKYFFAHS